MSTSPQILIVGGGFTGLTAALRLSVSSGCSIRLVESSSGLGGLAGGFELRGTALEKTYHHLFLTDTSILELVKELGLQDRLMWFDSSVAIFRDGRIYPFKTPMDLLRFAPCSLSDRVRTGLAVLYLKHRKNWRVLARQSAHQWMRRACGPSAMETIWTPLLKGKFNRHFDRVSMAWLWARIHIRANSRSGNAGEKLGYFRGGFNVVTQALEAELSQRGVRIQTGARVEKFSTPERAAIINGEKVPFDFCVFTGPSAAFAGLLSADQSLSEYRAKLRRIDYLGAVCLVFTSRQSLGQFYWVNVNDPGAPFLVFIQHTNLVDKAWYGGNHVYYIGAYVAPEGKIFSLPDEELTQDWLGYLPKMFPHFDTSQVEERFVFRFGAAQHIVGQDYEENIPAYKTPLPGVFLANFSQIFPEDRGTNFAVREGDRVAALVARELGQSATRPAVAKT